MDDGGKLENPNVGQYEIVGREEPTYMIGTKGFKIYRRLLRLKFCYCNGSVEINGDLMTMKAVPDCTRKYGKVTSQFVT